MSDEQWIERSLARLESLEAQKAEMEGQGQTAPPQLSAEISALYEALESAADGDDPTAASTEALPLSPAPADPFAAPLAANPVAEAPGSPFGTPPANPAGGGLADTSLGAPPRGFGEPADVAPIDFDDDFKPSSGKGGLVAIAAVVLAGLVGGGYWLANRGAAEPEPTEVEASEPRVISAVAVPEDTQEPPSVVGADPSAAAVGSEAKSAAARGSNSAKSRSGKRSKRKRNRKKDTGRRVKLGDSNDPLSGL